MHMPYLGYQPLQTDGRALQQCSILC